MASHEHQSKDLSIILLTVSFKYDLKSSNPRYTMCQMEVYAISNMFC